MNSSRLHGIIVTEKGDCPPSLLGNTLILDQGNRDCRNQHLEMRFSSLSLLFPRHLPCVLQTMPLDNERSLPASLVPVESFTLNMYQ